MLELLTFAGYSFLLFTAGMLFGAAEQKRSRK